VKNLFDVFRWSGLSGVTARLAGPKRSRSSCLAQERGRLLSGSKLNPDPAAPAAAPTAAPFASLFVRHDGNNRSSSSSAKEFCQKAIQFNEFSDCKGGI
jgi:hypothetical protein